MMVCRMPGGDVVRLTRAKPTGGRTPDVARRLLPEIDKVSRILDGNSVSLYGKRHPVHSLLQGRSVGYGPVAFLSMSIPNVKDWALSDALPIAVDRYDPQDAVDPAAHDFTEIVIIVGGHALRISEGDSWLVTAGDVLLSDDAGARLP
jgi:hypothetical protein